MFPRRFHAKLGDLGTTKEMALRMTPGVGTPIYTPPEMLGADVPPGGVDYAAADVYAAALCFWSILHLQVEPFPPSIHNKRQLIAHVTSGNRPDFDDEATFFSADLRALISRMWDGDPRARPSAHEVLDALHRIHQGLRRGVSGGSSAGVMSPGGGGPATGYASPAAGAGAGVAAGGLDVTAGSGVSSPGYGRR